MNPSSFSKYKLSRQFLISISLVLFVCLCCSFLPSSLGYRIVALILLMTVSIIAIFFNVRVVLTAAALSALAWNFLFIPPRFTFAISQPEDFLMFLMYFVVALVNAVLTTRIRKMEKEAMEREEKENTLKLYNTLLNSLSHELRTPISTIIGATDNLQSMNDKLSEHAKYELVTEISKASLQLNRQVGNLLNMSRLESGFLQVKTDWIDAQELVYDVLNQLRDHPKYKVVQTIIAEHLPLFKLDYGLVFQILHNLVHNALTYTPKYAVVSVKVSCRENNLVFVVEDTGFGFPPDEIDRVFEKFYRLKNSSTGGTGLGLSIVKGFVEAMHGKITLMNMPEG
ncbi:MAG: DUF4118 domain-containing protein, partial [Bacteroidia bacterium]|nr:DUF4118 domain-containing protein [Bacteroidia bacterium]